LVALDDGRAQVAHGMLLRGETDDTASAPNALLLEHRDALRVHPRDPQISPAAPYEPQPREQTAVVVREDAVPVRRGVWIEVLLPHDDERPVFERAPAIGHVQIRRPLEVRDPRRPPP